LAGDLADTLGREARARRPRYAVDFGRSFPLHQLVCKGRGGRRTVAFSMHCQLEPVRWLAVHIRRRPQLAATYIGLHDEFSGVEDFARRYSRTPDRKPEFEPVELECACQSVDDAIRSTDRLPSVRVAPGYAHLRALALSFVAPWASDV
jgi:hypothetical protein